MNTLTKVALGLVGQLKPARAEGYAVSTLPLPPAQISGGLPVMQAMQLRQSRREFDTVTLPLQTLSNLLWAAAGVNRPDVDGRTAPTAMNAREIDVYAAMPGGLYRYDAAQHQLLMVNATDVRRVTGYQDFVDTAPLDLVYVAHHKRMGLVPAAKRESYAWFAAGAMAQNAYLCCASEGLACVIRAWLSRGALAQAMELSPDEQVLVAQTIGMPGGGAGA